jgi:putative ABC transport system ATP-binding protein
MALLSLSNIHKTFEKGTVNENHVLRGLDLDIEQGDFISVIGGNGAGKSTLMNSIAGVVEIDEGDIRARWAIHSQSFSCRTFKRY